jgi:tetratricopeptide (TPR) repeat protein
MREKPKNNQSILAVPKNSNVYKRGLLTWLACVVVFTVIAGSLPQAEAAFSMGQATTLRRVKRYFREENYKEVYRMFLVRIPSFNPGSKTSEELFCYYALTCIYLARYDEAEGYLYTIKTKKQVPEVPALYDFCWAQLKDFRGEFEAAYDRYQFFVTLYPDDEMVPYAYCRIGHLALAQGLFYRAKYFFDLLINTYPLSPDAQLAQQTDDISLDHFSIVLGSFETREAAEARKAQLQSEEDITTSVHVTAKWGKLHYLVLAGKYYYCENAEHELEEYIKTFEEASIYPPLMEVHGTAVKGKSI